jgi:hypothetical protein
VSFGVTSWIVFVAALNTIHQITRNNTKHLNLFWRTLRLCGLAVNYGVEIGAADLRFDPSANEN